MALGGGIYGKFFVRGVAGNSAVCFHTYMVLRRAAEPVFTDIIRFQKSFINITPFDMTRHVNIPFSMIMELRGICPYCIKRFKNCRERFVFNFYQIHRFFGSILVNGSNSSHRFSDISDCFSCQNFLIAKLFKTPPYTLPDADGIFAGNNPFYTGQRFRLRCIYIENLCMGVRASQYLTIQHSW